MEHFPIWAQGYIEQLKEEVKITPLLPIFVEPENIRAEIIACIDDIRTELDGIIIALFPLNRPKHYLRPPEKSRGKSVEIQEKLDLDNARSKIKEAILQRWKVKFSLEEAKLAQASLLNLPIMFAVRQALEACINGS